MRNDSHDDFFRTADYGVVGYLFALGFETERLERNGPQVVFCFPNSPALLRALGRYTSNEPIGCRDMFHGLKRAKSIIQETIRNGSRR